MAKVESKRRPTVVVGEGIAGQATALALCEAGVPVLLLARLGSEQSESAARSDGVDAALDRDDSPERHAEDLLAAAAGFANGSALAALAEEAPALFERLRRDGIPFESSRSGSPHLEKMPGSTVARTAHAGALTARHVSRRLAQRLLAFEGAGLLERHVGWQLCDLIQSPGHAVIGVVAREHGTGQVKALRADGVCLATGGHTGLFAAETFAAPSLGAATGIAFRCGARLVDPDRVHESPLGYRAGGFLRTLPERLLALGGSVEAGLLDLTALDRAAVRRAAASALSAHRAHTGLDAYSEPIAVVDVPTRTLGGLWVDFDESGTDAARCHRTSLPGLYAAGGACAAYLGARLSAGVPLAAALFGGARAGRALVAYRESLESSAFDLPTQVFDEARERERARVEALLSECTEDQPSPFELDRTLRQVVARAVRGDDPNASTKLDALAAHLSEARSGDANACANAGITTLMELQHVLPLARAVLEARGTRASAGSKPLLFQLDEERGPILTEAPA